MVEAGGLLSAEVVAAAGAHLVDQVGETLLQGLDGAVLVVGAAGALEEPQQQHPGALLLADAQPDGAQHHPQGRLALALAFPVVDVQLPVGPLVAAGGGADADAPSGAALRGLGAAGGGGHRRVVPVRMLPSLARIYAMPATRRLSLLEALPAPLERGLEALCRQLDAFPQVVVAYSGGVDSALVAALAGDRLGERALAVTGVSPALAPTCAGRPATRPAGWACATGRCPPRNWQTPPTPATPRIAATPASGSCTGCWPRSPPLPGGPGAGRGQPRRPRRPPARDPGRPGVRCAFTPGGGRHRQSRCAPALPCPRVALVGQAGPALPCLPFPLRRTDQRHAAGPGGRRRGLVAPARFSRAAGTQPGETARIEIPAAGLPAALESLAQGELRPELVGAFRGMGFTAVALDLEGLVSGKLNRALAQELP